ncbi:hypothetical protein GGQ94_003261 [Petrimonas sulfuriphila]|jgi:hypothetical protein
MYLKNDSQKRFFYFDENNTKQLENLLFSELFFFRIFDTRTTVIDKKLYKFSLF